jgi:hypothetical protein
MTERDDEHICTNLGWHTYEELETILFDGILSEQETEDGFDCEERSKIPLKTNGVTGINNQCLGMQPATRKRAQSSSEPVWACPPFQPKTGATRCKYTLTANKVILICLYSFMENGRTRSPTNPA